MKSMMRFYNLYKAAYNLHDEVYNLYDAVYNLHEVVYNLHDAIYDLHEVVNYLLDAVNYLHDAVYYFTGDRCAWNSLHVTDFHGIHLHGFNFTMLILNCYGTVTMCMDSHEVVYNVNIDENRRFL
jgi:hypothetical protein